MTDDKGYKILEIGNVLPNKASGISTCIPNLIAGFRNNGIDVELYSFKQNHFRVALRKSELMKYDIFVFNSFYWLQFLTFLLLIPRHKQIIIAPHGSFSNKNPLKFKKIVYEKLFFSLIKIKKFKIKIHYLSEAEYSHSKFREWPYLIMGNSIPEAILLTAKKRSWNINKRQIKVLYLGRFKNHIKGLDLLIAHLYQFKQEYRDKNIQFDLYGPTTEDKTELERDVEKKGLDFVSFCDPVYGDDKFSLIDEYDFHIMTSRSEGFPMSVLETTARGCPQILSDGTMMYSLLEEYEFGYKFNDNLCGKLMNLTNEDYDRLVINSLRFAKGHVNNEMAKKTYEEYCCR